MSSFSLLFLAIFAFLFINHNVEAHKNQKGINPICKTVPNVHLCNKIVHGATNAHDASINAIHEAIYGCKTIQALTPLLIERAASNLESKVMDDLVKLCTEDFEGVVKELEISIRYINEGEISGADFYLRGAVSIPNDCRDAVTKQGTNILIMNKLLHRFNKVMNTTLVLVHQIQV